MRSSIKNRCYWVEFDLQTYLTYQLTLKGQYVKSGCSTNIYKLLYI